MNVSAFRTLLVLIVVLACGAIASSEEPDPQLAKVFADWKARQAKFKSIRYHLCGEVVDPKGCAPTPGGTESNTPPSDQKYPTGRTVLLDFTTGRHRMEEEETQIDFATMKRHPSSKLWVYDGKAIAAYRPRERNTHPTEGVKENQPEVGVGKGYFGMAAWNVVYWPLFAGHGGVGSYDVPILPGKPFALPKIEFMKVQGPAAHRGRACLVVQTQPRNKSHEEWWVDPARESAVVRYQMFLNNKPYIDAQIEHERTDRGWLPKSWTYTMWWTETGHARQIERVAVEKRDIDPVVQNEEFQVPQRPEMLVAHLNHPSPTPGQPPPPASRQNYRVEEDGRLREVRIEGGVVTPVKRSSWWWLALLPGLGLGAWLLSRWRKGRHAVA